MVLMHLRVLTYFKILHANRGLEKNYCNLWGSWRKWGCGSLIINIHFLIHTNPGGFLGIVLPDSILSNPGFKKSKHRSINSCSGGKAVLGELALNVVNSNCSRTLGLSILPFVPKGGLVTTISNSPSCTFLFTSSSQIDGFSRELA